MPLVKMMKKNWLQTTPVWIERCPEYWGLGTCLYIYGGYSFLLKSIGYMSKLKGHEEICEDMASALLRKCSLAIELTLFWPQCHYFHFLLHSFSIRNDHVRLNKQNNTLYFIIFKILLHGTMKFPLHHLCI